jgi:hypothetical protein
VVTLLAACDSVFDLEHIGPPAPGFRKPITITQQTQSMLTGFPISIVIESDTDLSAHAAADDIGFFNDSGVPLRCELVGFDATTGRLDAWVLVPTLPPDSAVYIDLVYGTSDARCERTSPWAEYLGVWHGVLAIDRVRDSSAHGHDVVAVGATTVPQSTPGIVGDALLYDGGDDVLCDPVDDDGSLAVDTTSFSYSALVYLTRDIGQYDSPFNKGGSSQANPGFDFELGTAQWRANVSDGMHMNPATVAPELLPVGRYNEWVQLAMVVDRSVPEVRTYVNGLARDNRSLTGWGSLTTDEPLCLGFDGAGLAGTVDEVRIYATALSSDWIAVEFANLLRRDEVITIGAETHR